MVTCPDLKIEYLLSLGFKIIVIVKTLGDTSHASKEWRNSDKIITS